MKDRKKDFFIKGFIGLFILVIVLSIFTGGAKLDKELKKKAEAIPELVEGARKTVDDHHKKYQALKKSKAFEPILPFAQKENWDNRFDKASQTLDRADQMYVQILKPLIKENTPEMAPKIRDEIPKIKAEIAKAKKIAQEPSLRYAAIQKAIANADQISKTATTNLKQITAIVNDLETGVVAKALNDFPDQKNKIDFRFAAVQSLAQTGTDHLNTINDQYTLHTAGKPADYAAFTDSATVLTASLEKAQNLESQIRKEMGQLYQSYTKILKDMKADLYVTIRRESWDENSDYYNPLFASFTRIVSPEAYDVLTSDRIENIGVITAGYTGSRFTNNVGRAWNELNLNPTDNWPSRHHNAAVFWVEDSREDNFHNYILEQDGTTSETGWTKVDPDIYDANLEFLGMAILAKPYGMFEKDALTQAAPPGMAYVGNDQYGEWKEDDNGDRFWSWYGKYMFFSNLFFFPPTYFYYNSWYGWHNNYRYNKPYFGKTPNGFNKYGTYGTYVKKSSNFQNTHFAKSGGFKSQTASVRGAAAGLRGGGPKSKGK